MISPWCMRSRQPCKPRSTGRLLVSGRVDIRTALTLRSAPKQCTPGSRRNSRPQTCSRLGGVDYPTPSLLIGSVHLFAALQLECLDGLVLVKLFCFAKVADSTFQCQLCRLSRHISQWVARSPTAESESDMDEFDSILNLEDEWEQEGRREGAEKGRQAGFSPVSSARDNVG